MYDVYCFTYVNGLTCVLNELLLWSEISKEHPVFIKTVADLTGKNLSQQTKNNLTAITDMFEDVHRKTRELQQHIAHHPQYFYNYIGQVKEVVEEFLLHDTHFFEVLAEVKQYGQNDPVWQELLEHITKEQQFMYQLFSDIKMQLSYY